MIFTESQTAALETLVLLGRLFFGGAPRDNINQPLQLRLFPLIAGPTGVGKSFLVQQAAQTLHADYFRLTRGDWIVVGSKAGRPTTWQIIDRALARDLVLLHVDELDKFQIDFRAQEWSAAMAADLWSVLDQQLPVEEYWAQMDREVAAKTTPARIMRRVRKSLWIVGSGTWQGAFENARKSQMGFQPARNEIVTAHTLAHMQLISPELLFRFNSDVLLLQYPDHTETTHLLIKSGIAALARKLGIEVRASDIDWTRGGVRVLESVLTRLTIEEYRRRMKVGTRPVPIPPMAEQTHAPS